jgi:hypothetical protein
VQRFTAIAVLFPFLLELNFFTFSVYTGQTRLFFSMEGLMGSSLIKKIIAGNDEAVAV